MNVYINIIYINNINIIMNINIIHINYTYERNKIIFLIIHKSANFFLIFIRTK